MTDGPVVRDVAGPDLAVAELYGLLRLRAEVFVVEQGCCYLDPDGADLLPTTRHLWAAGPGGAPVAALRVLAEPGRWRIGRVATRPEARGDGLAGQLLDTALATTDRPVVLAAQSHLATWYGRWGFEQDGPEFLEDGIPHTPMRLDAPAARPS